MRSITKDTLSKKISFCVRLLTGMFVPTHTLFGWSSCCMNYWAGPNLIYRYIVAVCLLKNSDGGGVFRVTCAASFQSHADFSL